MLAQYFGRGSYDLSRYRRMRAIRRRRVGAGINRDGYWAAPTLGSYDAHLLQRRPPAESRGGGGARRLPRRPRALAHRAESCTCFKARLMARGAARPFDRDVTGGGHEASVDDGSRTDGLRGAGCVARRTRPGVAALARLGSARPGIPGGHVLPRGASRAGDRAARLRRLRGRRTPATERSRSSEPVPRPEPLRLPARRQLEQRHRRRARTSRPRPRDHLLHARSACRSAVGLEHQQPRLRQSRASRRRLPAGRPRDRRVRPPAGPRVTRRPVQLPLRRQRDREHLLLRRRPGPSRDGHRSSRHHHAPRGRDRGSAHARARARAKLRPLAGDPGGRPSRGAPSRLGRQHPLRNGRRRNGDRAARGRHRPRTRGRG